MGWKKFQDKLHCKACWTQRYVLRACIIPVAGPVDGDWQLFRDQLRLAWRQSTELANFYVTELAKADIVRTADMEKLPPAPKLYLYPLGRARCPALASQSVVAIEHSVRQRYNRTRLDVIWRGSATLPRYTYPYPYPVPATGWTAAWLSETERVPLVSIRLGDARIVLRLRGGAQFRRQLAQFGEMIAGEVLTGALDLYRVPANASDHRPTDFEKHRIMVKMVGWFPLRSAPDRKGVCRVRTAEEQLLVAECDGRDPWIFNADRVRQQITGYERRRQRLSQDTKFEKRWPAESRRQLAEVRDGMTTRQHHYLDTFCHTAAKLLVGFALRQNVARLEYNDSVRDYMPTFPWHKLSQLIEQKCQSEGLEFASATESAKASAGARSDEPD
jgi:hypothetical protein